MSPVREVFRTARKLQRLWSTARDTASRETVEALLREVIVHLDAHTRFAGGQIASVLSAVDSPELTARRERAAEAWAELRREIEEVLLQLPAAGSAWRHLWDIADDLLARRLRGAGLRTVFEPFESVLAPAVSIAPVGAGPATTSNAFGALPPLPGPEDLRPLGDERFSAVVLAHVEELGRDAERIFRFVAETLAFSPYAGHFRAPAEVLADGVGNDADLAGLLVELLRAAGHPARLAAGPVRESLPDLGKRLDVRSPTVVAQLLRDSGNTIFVHGESADVFGRVWVQAWLSELWVDLDPTERDVAVESGVPISWHERWTPIGETAETEASTEREYLEDPQATRGPLAFFETRVKAALSLAGAPAGEPLEASFRKRSSLPAPEFPPPLRGQRLQPATVARGFEERDTWSVSLQCVAADSGTILEVARPLPERNRGSWTLTWVPATAAAEQFLALGPGLGGLPCFAVDLKPRLELRDATGALLETIDGAGMTTGGAAVHLMIQLRAPVAGQTRTAQSRVVAGDAWALRIEPPGAHLVDLPVPNRLPLVEGANPRAALLPSLLEAYHRRLSMAARRVAQLGDAVALTGPWATLFGTHLEPLIVAKQVAAMSRSHWQLDVKVIDFRLYPSNDSSSLRGFEELFFAEGSWLEAAWFRELMNRRATSTIEALRQSVAGGIPLLTIGRGDEEALARLELPDAVLNAIRMALASRHRTATIPQRAVRFAGRDVVAWIARRDEVPPSEYAIAGLGGGLGDDDPIDHDDDDDDEPPKKPSVTIHRTPQVQLVDLHESEDYGATATDPEGRDLTGSIQWHSSPPAGGGSGGSAQFTPSEPGTYDIVAQVSDVTDSCSFVTPRVEIVDVSLPSPAVKLSHVVRSPNPVVKIETVEGPLFSLEGKKAVPAGLWCGHAVALEVKLRITHRANCAFRLRVEAEDPDGRVEVDPVSDDIEQDDKIIRVTLRAGDKIGITTALDWRFALDDGSFLRTQNTAVEIFVSRREPHEVRGHVEEHNYRWACMFANALTAQSSDEEVLDWLAAGRPRSLLQYGGRGRQPQNAYELIAYKRGMCGEFAEWFLCLAAIHGITGRRYELKVIPRDPPRADSGWLVWFAFAAGLNNASDFNSENHLDRDIVERGKYVTGATSEKDVIKVRDAGPPLSEERFWSFQQHYVAVFDLGRPVLYDASFHPGASPTSWPLETIGDIVVEVALDDNFRSYLRQIMPVLGGYLFHPATKPTYVWHEDIDGNGESLRIQWTAT